MNGRDILHKMKEKVGFGSSSSESGKGKSKMSKNVTHGYHLVKGKSYHDMEDYVFAEFKQINNNELGLFAIYDDVPTVSETKANFLQAYKRPIPSIYNTVLQELIVQQHLTRYKRTHRYDAVFALGFVTVYDRLMEGYPSDEDREAIFRAYIKALQEDPEQYSPNLLIIFNPEAKCLCGGLVGNLK